MCGIAGWVGLGDAPAGVLVDAMTRSMAHRGPDDAGLLLRPHAALGHRRLAIVDLRDGRQPMSNEDGSVWIAYNGEVYNHERLRASLVDRGHRFRTRSDTEAIVHAYEEHGLRCMTQLRGMFAFAIWDAPRRRLLLARDRLGIKPLYYAQLGESLIFASDLRALLLSPDVDRGIDEDALGCYLALRYVPAPRTLIRGVRKLPPASFLVWEGGALRIEKYWDLLDAPRADGHISPDAPTEIEAAAQVYERLDDCVRMRLMSEVPVGSFLSGGLDSTAVTAAMMAVRAPGSPPLATFSVGYEEESADSELAWAALASTALGTRHRELRVSHREAAALLPRIASDLDEPLADPASVPLWFLARRAREDVTVVLSGEGADELYAGYATYRHMQDFERLRRLGLRRLGSLVAALAPPSRLTRAARMLGLPLERGYRGVSRAFDADGARLLVGEPGQARMESALSSVLEPLWERTRTLSPLRRMLYLDLSVWLPDDLLLKADKMTMAHGLELRVPILDHHLVEHAFGLPDRLKLAAGPSGQGKHILRRAVRGRVPRAILERPKMGFATPSPAWLRGPMAELLRDALLDERSLCRQRFAPAFVARLIDEHARGRIDRAPELWALLALELWLVAIAQIPVIAGGSDVNSDADSHRPNVLEVS